MMRTTDLMSLQPTVLKTDIAAIWARRIIAQRLKAEGSADRALRSA